MLERVKPAEVGAMFVPCTILCWFFPWRFFSISLLLFWSCVCNEWITTQQLWSQWSDPGTASDLLHQAVREAWQIQHHMGGRWGIGGGGGRRSKRSRAGPKGPSQSPCSICLPHPSPLHILRRAETASHAETNVKINHYDLSCSGLPCSPLVTFPFHSHSRAISSPQQKNKKCPPLHSKHPPPPFYAKWAAATISSPSVLSLAEQNTAEALWGGL